MHIENIHHQHNFIQQNNFFKSEMNRCPRCGNKLVLRTATRGTRIGHDFWGCSNYPKCRFIKNIN